MEPGGGRVIYPGPAPERALLRRTIATMVNPHISAMATRSHAGVAASQPITSEQAPLTTMAPMAITAKSITPETAPASTAEAPRARKRSKK